MSLFGGRKPKEEENVLKILKREFKLFLRLYDIANNLHSSADDRNIKRTQKYFKQLRMWERREQWRWGASVSKLKDAMNELLNLPILNANAKSKIKELVRSMSVYEGDLLERTVKELGPKIEGKKREMEVNWSEVIGIAYKLMQDLRALTALDQEITKLVKG